jgi:hypothetical protein
MVSAPGCRKRRHGDSEASGVGASDPAVAEQATVELAWDTGHPIGGMTRRRLAVAAPTALPFGAVPAGNGGTAIGSYLQGKSRLPTGWDSVGADRFQEARASTRKRDVALGALENTSVAQTR